MRFAVVGTAGAGKTTYRVFEPADCRIANWTLGKTSVLAFCNIAATEGSPVPPNSLPLEYPVSFVTDDHLKISRAGVTTLNRPTRIREMRLNQEFLSAIELGRLKP